MLIEDLTFCILIIYSKDYKYLKVKIPALTNKYINQLNKKQGKRYKLMYNKEYQNRSKIQIKNNSIRRLTNINNDLLGNGNRRIVEDNIQGSFIKDQKQQTLYLQIMEELVRYTRTDDYSSDMREQYPDQLENSYSNEEKTTKKTTNKNQNMPASKQNEQQNSRIKNPYSLTPLKLQKLMGIVVDHCDRQGKTKNIYKIFYLILKYFSMKAKGNRKQQKISTIDAIQWLNHAQSLFIQQLDEPPFQNRADNIIIESSARNIKKVSESFKQKIKSSNVAINKSSSDIFLFRHSFSQLKKNNPYSFLLQSINQYDLDIVLAQLEQVINTINTKISSCLTSMDENDYNLQKIEVMREKLSLRVHWLIEIISKQIYMEQQLQKNINKNNKTTKVKGKSTGQTTKLTEKDSRIYRSNIQFHIMNSIRNKKYKNYQVQYAKMFSEEHSPTKNRNNSEVPEKILELYEQISITLKYMLSVFLGNQDVIRIYAGNNIYLYLKLYIFYIHSADAYDGMNSDLEFNVDKSMQLVIQHLQKLHDVIIGQEKYQLSRQDPRYNFKSSKQPRVSLSQTHNLLLLIFSVNQKPLPPQIPPSRLDSNFQSHPLHKVYPQLAYHKIFQTIISIFKGYQFYGYLINTIIFNMGFVNKEIFMLDEQYQSNMIQELMLCAISQVRSQFFDNNTKPNVEPIIQVQNQIERQEKYMERQGMYFINEQNSILNEQNQFDHSYGKLYIENVPNEQELEMKKVEENKKKKEQQKYKQKYKGLKLQVYEQNQFQRIEMRRIKLLLCVISFYKNVLYKTTKYKELYLKYKMALQAKDIIVSTLNRNKEKASLRNNQNVPPIYVMYTSLPLHALIDSLLAQRLPFQHVTTYYQIHNLKIISQYANQLDLQQYYGRYLRNLLTFNIGNITDVCSGRQRGLMINNFSIELLILDLENSVWAIQSEKLNIYQKKFNSMPINSFFFSEQQIQYENNFSDNLFLQNVDYPYSHYYYNSYVYAFLNSNFLTNCTLVKPFPYHLMDIVQENVDLLKRNRLFQDFQGLNQFQQCFGIYSQLDYLTARGKYKPSLSYSNQNKISQQMNTFPPLLKRFQNTEKKKESGYFYNLPYILQRLNVVIELISAGTLQGCGQILRVTWQILEDYQQIRRESAKQNLRSEQEQQILSKMSDKLMQLVGQLGHYLEQMQRYGYICEVYVKIKEMIG